MNTESKEIVITKPISDCPRTGLPRVARMQNINISLNGSIIMNYTEDVLDNQSEVFVRGDEMKNIQFLPYPINGPQGAIETPYLLEHQELVNVIKPKLEALLDTINAESTEPSEEEE